MAEREPYLDDPSVPNDAILWRWVEPFRFHDEAGCPKWADSSVFKASTDGTPMSVVRASVWLQEGHTPREFLDQWCPPGSALMQFTASDARACQQVVLPDREPTAADPPGHTYVQGPNKRKRHLKRYAIWVIPPDGYVPETYPPGHVRRGPQ